jgi:hypothetical protein
MENKKPTIFLSKHMQKNLNIDFQIRIFICEGRWLV